MAKKKTRKRTVKKKKNDYENIMIVGMVVFGIILFVYNYFFLNIPIINIMAVIVVLIGPIILEYDKYSKNKDIEEKFPDFLRDVSENIKSGMTLPKAIAATKKNDYGPFTPFVKKMAVQMDWGVPFDDILEGLKIKSPVIKRTISIIIETHRGGGKISDILNAVGKSITEINKLRKERKSSVYSQMVTGYIIFFVFLGVLVTLQTFLVPSLSVVATTDLGGNVEASYNDLFQWLILIQGVFSGLVIGKMSEGSIFAGAKHALILGLVGYLAIIFLI